MSVNSPYCGEHLIIYTCIRSSLGHLKHIQCHCIHCQLYAIYTSVKVGEKIQTFVPTHEIGVGQVVPV